VSLANLDREASRSGQLCRKWMTLKRTAYTGPLTRQFDGSTSRGLWGLRRSPWVTKVVEHSLVQILVVVAITQMRILRTEEGKGSVITVFGYGLVDPKAQVNSN